MATAAGDVWAGLFEACTPLLTGWPGAAWKWDGRFEAVESAFPRSAEAVAREKAVALLPSVWTSATVKEAPEAVRALAADTGGLRAGQLLFSAAPVESALPFGLWWPWGDGKTVTLRIGLSGLDAGAPAVVRLVERFGVKR
ncbi:MAG: hypothetical protein K1X89_30060 [Myxococcaceae bacterium]|nr:hypothetical protein [Myxococcaceae bacterium]